MIDLWPLIVPVFLGAIVYQWRENHQLKIRVAVLENTVENLETTLGDIRKRQDSQSRKQDDILDRIGLMEKEVLKQIGTMESNISSLTSDLKSLNNLLSISGVGVKTNRK